MIKPEKYSVINTLGFISKDKPWKNLTAIIQREFKNSDKPTEKAVRYYISNLKAAPVDFQKAIRSHW